MNDEPSDPVEAVPGEGGEGVIAAPAEIDTVGPTESEPKEAEATNYESMTVAQLRELAASRGITGRHDMRKDEIIEALEEA